MYQAMAQLRDKGAKASGVSPWSSCSSWSRYRHSGRDRDPAVRGVQDSSIQFQRVV
jgi:hypothetical protein